MLTIGRVDVNQLTQMLISGNRCELVDADVRSEIRFFWEPGTLRFIECETHRKAMRSGTQNAPLRGLRCGLFQGRKQFIPELERSKEQARPSSLHSDIDLHLKVKFEKIEK